MPKQTKIIWHHGGRPTPISERHAIGLLSKAFWDEGLARDAIRRLRSGEADEIDGRGWGRFGLNEKEKAKIQAAKNRAARGGPLKKVR